MRDIDDICARESDETVDALLAGEVAIIKTPGGLLRQQLPPDIRKQIAALVKAAKEATGWSSTKLAKQTGLSRVAISRMENEHPQARASLQTLDRIARASGKRVRLSLE